MAGMLGHHVKLNKLKSGDRLIVLRLTVRLGNEWNRLPVKVIKTLSSDVLKLHLYDSPTDSVKSSEAFTFYRLLFVSKTD